MLVAVEAERRSALCHRRVTVLHEPVLRKDAFLVFKAIGAVIGNDLVPEPESTAQ